MPVASGKRADKSPASEQTANAIGGSAAISGSSSEKPKKRTIYDFFGADRGGSDKGGESNKQSAKKIKNTSKKKIVNSVNTLIVSDDVLIPVGYNDLSALESIRLLTRNRYLQEEGMTLNKDELSLVGCLKKDPVSKKYKAFSDNGQLEKDLNSRKVMLKEESGVYKAVNAGTFFRSSDVRSLEEAKQKFGNSNIWLQQNDGTYANSSSLGAERGAGQFARHCDTIYETRKENLPDALFKLPDGNYGGMGRADADWSNPRSELNAASAAKQRSVIILSFNERGYYCPKTLKFISENKDDLKYYNNKINSLDLPADISDCPRPQAPKVLAQHCFEHDLFYSEQNIMSMSQEDCHGFFHKTSVFIQNRNEKGDFTGNFARFEEYERGNRSASQEQEKVLRRMGFNNFLSDELIKKRSTEKDIAECQKSDDGKLQQDARRELNNRSTSSFCRD